MHMCEKILFDYFSFVCLFVFVSLFVLFLLVCLLNVLIWFDLNAHEQIVKVKPFSRPALLTKPVYCLTCKKVVNIVYSIQYQAS